MIFVDVKDRENARPQSSLSVKSSADGKQRLKCGQNPNLRFKLIKLIDKSCLNIADCGVVLRKHMPMHVMHAPS